MRPLEIIVIILIILFLGAVIACAKSRVKPRKVFPAVAAAATVAPQKADVPPQKKPIRQPICRSSR